MRLSSTDVTTLLEHLDNVSLGDMRRNPMLGKVVTRLVQKEIRDANRPVRLSDDPTTPTTSGGPAEYAMGAARLLQGQNMVGAIKVIRNEKGLDLRESKDVIDYARGLMYDGQPLTSVAWDIEQKVNELLG